MNNYNSRILCPSPEDINRYCHPARISTMTTYLGPLHTPLSEQCQTVKASDKVKSLLVTRDIGPFQLTGIAPFLKVLENVFAMVKEDNIDLYNALGTAGCFCARYVRGSTTQPSNHSWASAIDMKMYDTTLKQFVLDPRGDGKVQTGCLELYKYFKQYGLQTGEWIFWGAGFPTEDGMHFEASDELIRRWAATKVI